jgi:prepilin-type processing-associated H-X9-DG protein
MSRNPRKAITLLELMVALAIIAILTGLLLPAVQKVRTAAATVRCKNNIKQLALAAHNYHDAHEGFPAGCSYQNGSSLQPHMSWLNRLLPYLEQEAIWQRSLIAFSQDRFFETPPHFPNLERVVTLLVCPSDSSARSAFDFRVFRVAFTDYLRVWGTDHRQMDGVFYLDSATRLSDITDGTTNTLMIGERPPSSDHNLGWWYAGWGQSKDGSADMILGVRELIDSDRYRRKCPAGPYRFGPGTDSNVCDAFHFWSRHPGGANFAFCDGSVRFLTYGANSIMPALATRAGGEVVEIP